ncbi:uncharacterized protein LOC135168089 isoform X6 [Diachasmimorpha longicaudata]|uniref:uncharacterized protein LOC135168089 isoform X6 n=1 Tax=Diachasmimorpha longicaudata TaxID=58733 RepID=UPI0030B8FBA5
MLCSVADIALSIGFKVIFVQVLHSAAIVIVGAALPPGAEDEIVLIEHLPGRRVHLEDFFWTGAEDAPPWLDPDQTLTFYETRTIHHTATVLVPGEGIVPGPSENIPSVAPQDPTCTNCIEPTPTLVDPDQDIGILVGDDPGPRYWLLTVLRSGESIPSKVELRLARLYRAAFARQQQRHLGLLSTDPRLRRATKRRLITANTKSILKTPNDSAEKITSIDSLSLVTEASSSLQVKNEGVRMQNTTVLEDGSTRLIYSVHLGGKPVPAETAAKDMSLLSPQEVALELGAPVIIQSEPYLKESRPLALSRRRDAWLLIGAASVALILLLVLAGIILALKRKKAHSAVSAPPTQSILKKERVGYTPTTPGLDNTGYTSETEGRTEGTSQRPTPGSISRSPATPITPDTFDEDIHELSSDNTDDKEEGDVKKQGHEHWDIEEYSLSGKKSRTGRPRMTRTNAIETTGSPDSLNTMVDHPQHRDSLENGCIHLLEETASPHSYLSMPSCKLFPSMRSVEPLSRILEPVVVRHLDMEFETPEMSRRGNGFSQRDSGDELLGRTRSALKDPGVVGPIVWDLRRQRAVEESLTSETDVERQAPSSGPVGRARRRLHELLEDSFSLFSTREVKQRDAAPVSSTLHPRSAALTPDRITTQSVSRGKSAHVSPVGSPIDSLKNRPRTSVSRNDQEVIPETGNMGPPARGAWGSRPMSAGPFHRPNLPEVDVTRVLADSQLAPEDPAVPLIAAIRKELEKFTPEGI